MTISETVLQLRREIPAHVQILAAAKTRSAVEVREAIEAGIGIIGENYVQEAASIIGEVGRGAAEWHLIGHLQRNKVKQALELFDVIETLDSLRLAVALDKQCRKIGRTLSVLVEVNAARESEKSGLLPAEVEPFVHEMGRFPRLRIDGLMTMGPLVENPEALRPYFAEVRGLYDRLKRLRLPHAPMKWLSMGMSDSYPVAIEEGATTVRLGTVLFGPRKETMDEDRDPE